MSIKSGIACIGCSLVMVGLFSDPATAQEENQWAGAYSNFSFILGDGEVKWDRGRSRTNRIRTNKDNKVDVNLGIHGGYNFAYDKYVFGAEAGFLSGLGGEPRIDCRKASGLPGKGSRFCEREIKNVFTIGANVGRAFGEDNATLGFLSAGYANAKLTTLTYRKTEGPSDSRLNASSRRHDGFYVGIGARHAITEHLFLNADVRHYRFSSKNQKSNLGKDFFNVQGNATVGSVGLGFKF